MKYQRNKALENAITKVLSEAPSIKAQTRAAMDDRTKAEETGSRAAKARATRRIRELANKSIKNSVSNRTELEKEKMPSPSRGKVSDVTASLSSKLSSKLNLPTKATEKKPETSGIKIGVMRRQEHEAIKPAASAAPTSSTLSPRKESKPKRRRPLPSFLIGKKAPEDHSKKSSEEVRSLISSGHLPIHSSSLELLRNAMKREEFNGTKHNKKAISFYNRMSQEISGSYNTHPEEPTPGLHSSRFQKALYKVKSKIGLIKNKELPVRPYHE